MYYSATEILRIDENDADDSCYLSTHHSVILTFFYVYCSYLYQFSFAQYVTIGDKMRKGKQEFVELNGAPAEALIIRRNPRFTDNALLPAVHTAMLGDKILK